MPKLKLSVHWRPDGSVVPFYNSADFRELFLVIGQKFSNLSGASECSGRLASPIPGVSSSGVLAKGQENMHV